MASVEERDQLDALPNILWAFHWQQKAWANGKYSRMWVRKFGQIVQEKAPGEHLLFLDDLGCQKTEEFNSIAMAYNIFPFRFHQVAQTLCNLLITMLVQN